MRTALSMSQSLKMMSGDFPPSSRETFFRLLTAQLWWTRGHSHGWAGLAGRAWLAEWAGLAGRAGLVERVGLAGQAGLAEWVGLAGRAGLAGWAGLAGQAGLAGRAGLAGQAGLALTWPVPLHDLFADGRGAGEAQFTDVWVLGQTLSHHPTCGWSEGSGANSHKSRGFWTTKDTT